jgi:hypothetical protein
MASLKEQDCLDYEDEMWDAEESDTEDRMMISAFIGDARIEAWSK